MTDVSDSYVNELAREVVELGANTGYTVAYAESLTGGLCAATLVQIPGASRVLQGAIVAYATELKSRLLAVDTALLEQYGPVHFRVAEQMAKGVREQCAPAIPKLSLLGDDEHSIAAANSGLSRCIGIATTGVAGPDPDPQTEQAPGTVFIAVSSNQRTFSKRLHLHGTRDSIRQHTVVAALELLRNEMIQLQRGVDLINLSPSHSGTENSQE